MKHAISMLLKTSSAVAASMFITTAWGVDLPGPVVSTEWLANHQGDVQVVEVRSNFSSFAKQPIFETDKKTGKKTLVDVGGHIQDAKLVDFKNIRAESQIGEKKVKNVRPVGNDFQALMQSVGVVEGKPIVLVAEGQNISDIDEALRLYWTLKVYGEKQIAVLDGGATAWLAEGRAVSNAPAATTKGNWTAKGENLQLIATSDEVAQAIQNKSLQLLDARPINQFYGVVKSPVVLAYGRLEGAKDFAPELLTRGANGAMYFHSPKVYQSLFKASGIDVAAPTISYCNTGHLASGAWFAMSEIAGNKSTKLYDGSLSRWTAEKRPMVNAAM